MINTFQKYVYIKGNNFAINLFYANCKTQTSNKQLSKSIKHKYMQN